MRKAHTELGEPWTPEISVIAHLYPSLHRMLTDTEGKTPRLAFPGKQFVALTKNLHFAPLYFLKQQPPAPHTGAVGGMHLMGMLSRPALGFIPCVVVTDLWPGQLLVAQRNNTVLA